MPFYRQIAFVCHYSASLESNLREVFRLKKMFGASITIICFGKHAQDLSHLQNLVRGLNNSAEEVPIYWEYKQKLSKILTLCYKHDVDLLVQEASKRQNKLPSFAFVNHVHSKEKYYVSSFARRLLHKSPCSLMFLLDKKTPPQQGKGQLLISTNEQAEVQNVLKHGFAWAKAAELKQVFILKEAKMMGLSLILSDAYTEQEVVQKHDTVIADEVDSIYQSILSLERPEGMDLKIEVSSEKAGYELARFSSVINATLLVANIRDYQTNFLQRFISNHLEYILSNLPCNLLLVNHQN